MSCTTLIIHPTVWNHHPCTRSSCRLTPCPIHAPRPFLIWSSLHPHFIHTAIPLLSSSSSRHLITTTPSHWSLLFRDARCSHWFLALANGNLDLSRIVCSPPPLLPIGPSHSTMVVVLIGSWPLSMAISTCPASCAHCDFDPMNHYH